MKILKLALHLSFWVFTACVGLIVAALLQDKNSTLAAVAPYAAGGVLLAGAIYIVVLGVLADKYGKSGGLWAFLTFVFAPLGIFVSYGSMLRLMASGAAATGSALPSYSPAQKKWHWQLIIAFVIFVIIVKIVMLVFK